MDPSGDRGPDRRDTPDRRGVVPAVGAVLLITGIIGLFVTVVPELSSFGWSSPDQDGQGAPSSPGLSASASPGSATPSPSPSACASPTPEAKADGFRTLRPEPGDLAIEEAPVAVVTCDGAVVYVYGSSGSHPSPGPSPVQQNEPAGSPSAPDWMQGWASVVSAASAALGGGLLAFHKPLKHLFSRRRTEPREE
ncbi:hypothetical protein [Streptomonospora salina]|uniref:Uncharacterized protein n=1 Tax=Streptomonospora salina TaxID=104205 RepID=A0A841E8W1_9ACTN|nr:hypothetical protein [Streptomonospora salina]MBB6000427.1 hypothetical protein [Streptomonospora salina]